MGDGSSPVRKNCQQESDRSKTPANLLRSRECVLNLLDGCDDRIDPEKWRPLIMSFCQFFGLGPILHPSRLAEIPESAYRPVRRVAA